MESILCSADNPPELFRRLHLWRSKYLRTHMTGSCLRLKSLSILLILVGVRLVKYSLRVTSMAAWHLGQAPSDAEGHLTSQASGQLAGHLT